MLTRSKEDKQPRSTANNGEVEPIVSQELEVVGERQSIKLAFGVVEFPTL
jgi:hypothetical protein